METQREAPSARGAVVVGVDTSRAGQQALEWAAAQAAAEHRSLVLVRATGTLGTAGTTWLDTDQAAGSKAVDQILWEGQALLDPAAQRAGELHPGLVVGTWVAHQDPAPELLRLTDVAHLLVVGSRGGHLLRHVATWQIGSRVAGRAFCPVVVVPSYDAREHRQGVLVGVDLSLRSRSVLRFAFEQAARLDQPLTVVHFNRFRAERPDADRLLAEAVAGFREEFPDVHTELRAIHGSPTVHLLRMAATRHLVVIGQHHELGTYESPMHHVHANIVDRCPCPIAVVPLEVSMATSS